VFILSAERIHVPVLKDFAISIITTLREAGFQAYLVGGCVRDLLLGREPADYDVATDATPDEVMRIFPETYAVGAQFGVVLVPMPDEEQPQMPRLPPNFAERNSDSARDGKHLEPQEKAGRGTTSKANVVEVATFRSDIGYSDGRHPDEVRFTREPQEDMRRRDFTINGMMLDPLVDDPLKNGVLDFVGGRNDLTDKIIRAIGEPERRFAEDKLRMLRAVRFAARFEYTIEPGTIESIQKLAPQIHHVSRERVRDELTRMLTEGQARRAFLLLDETGLLREVLPEISAMKGVEQPPQFHPEGDVFVHTLLVLDKLPQPCPPTLAWGALLHDVGKPATFRVAPDRIRFDGHVDVGVKIAEEICRRLCFSKDDAEQILMLVDNHMRFAQVDRMKESTLKRFLRLRRFEEHLALHRADCEASHGDLRSYNLVREKLGSITPESIRPAPLVTGDDLIAAGYQPGPRFKEILTTVEDAQLEGRLPSKESAMELVRREFPPS
jgi:poly(A) polymerase